MQQALYLIFNEGYYSAGDQLVDRELCRQAIVLVRSLCRSFPSPESIGLLSLMLFHDARAPARVTELGEIVTLDEQDRSLWKHQHSQEADVLLQKALRSGIAGSYQLQAAIAGLHSLAEQAADTDWPQIVGLYQRLLQVQWSSVIELNYSVALMMAGDLPGASKIIASLEGELQAYSPFFAAQARLFELLDDPTAAALALEKATAVSDSQPERRHYRLRLSKMGYHSSGSH